MHIGGMIQAIDIKKFRKDIGWSQEKLAEELGVDRSNVSRWENDKSSLRGPARRMFQRLMEEMNTEGAA